MSEFALLWFQVSDWWEEYIYLRGRGPIMVNSNYYGMVICQYPNDAFLISFLPFFIPFLPSFLLLLINFLPPLPDTN